MIKLLPLLVVLCTLAAYPAQQAQPPSGEAPPQASSTTVEQRTQLNLLGQTDARSGESRRNENVQLSPLDTNIQRDLNQRLGTTATIVSEFQSDRSFFSTEYGNAPSGLLHVSPKNGRAFHGRLYESHLNSVLSSRSFFQVGGVKPARENDYGAEILTPLWGKASLSLQANQQKIRGMVNGNVLVPLPSERTPLTTDPAARAFVQRIIDAYPNELPNRPDIDPRMLNTNAPQRINGDTVGAQLDQAIGDRDHLSLRHLFVYQQVDAFQLVAGQNPDTTTRSNQSRLTWTRQWTPFTQMRASFGFDRAASLVVPEPNNVGPTFTIAGLQDVGPSYNIPTDRADSIFRQAVHVGHSRGSHAFMWGMDVSRRRFNGLQSDSHRGLVRITSDLGRDAITNLRMGTFTSMQFSVGNVRRGFRSWNLAYYFGDKWRASTNLTLTYGLRYQPSPAPTEAHNRNLIPYGCDCNNFAPQFGLAWSLPKWMGVLRAGYGLNYGAIMPVTYGLVRFSPPENSRRVIQQPDIATLLSIQSGTSAGQTGRESMYVLDPNMAQPYAHQYNLNWEPKFARAWKLQVGYVGSRTFKLPQLWYVNRARVEVGGTTANIDARRPDARYSELRYLYSSSRAWFDAAKVTLLMPRWRGFTLDASYWFSKTLDLGANYSDTGNISRQTRSQWEFNSRQDLKGLTDFDQPHAFLARLGYDTPKLTAPPRWVSALARDWNLSAAVLLKSGTPFTVESNSDSPGLGNVDGSLGDRVDLLDPSILGRTIGNPDTSAAQLPRSAFAFMKPGQAAGNLGRNVFRKGPIENINAAVARKLAIGGEKVLQLRAESVNLLNAAQFASPGPRLADGDFGKITNTLNEGRTFRFLVSFEF